MFKKYRLEKGSITLEAAIALTIFICSLVSIMFIIKIVYVHSKIQNAIEEAAAGISSISYLFYISGAQESYNAIQLEADKKAEGFAQYTKEFYSFIESVSSEINSYGLVEINKTNEILEVVNSIMTEDFESVKSQLWIPLLRAYVKKHLLANRNEEIDSIIKMLNIKGSFDDLDFNQSRFFENSSNEIDIVVRYKMNLPIPIKAVSDPVIVQRFSTRGWMGGDDGNSVKEQEDIWALQNMQRGMRVRQIFGANLPWLFPGISSFSHGRVTLIRSIDLTANSYQTPQDVDTKIFEYVQSIATYEGQAEPWGKEKIVINEKEITSRELILVIPKNTVAPEVRETVYEWVKKAQSMGVILSIEEYGYKKSVDAN